MRENFIHKFHFFAIFEMSTGVADIYEPVHLTIHTFFSGTIRTSNTAQKQLYNNNHINNEIFIVMIREIGGIVLVLEAVS